MSAASVEQATGGEKNETHFLRLFVYLSVMNEYIHIYKCFLQKHTLFI